MDSLPDGEGSLDSEYYNARERHHVLADDAFQNETSRELFNALDDLKSCGAGRDINYLPEIVIVGDQSVGKSSLLQGLTEIPFPVAGKLCTRFPTRIVSRRDDKELTKVSIEPCLFSALDVFEPIAQQEARQARQARYKDFEKVYPTFTEDDFSSVIKSAAHFMQIIGTSSSNADTESKPSLNFSEDTLKIEIQGPSRSHFAILDLPGNFHSLTGGLVDRDMKLVRNLILRHMGYSQSIIVCVASGPTDLANQGVFDMASEKDPKGDRTIGVITKCDVPGESSEIVDIVKNETKHLRHGWFVVRNRTPKDNFSLQEHHQKEQEFFGHQEWNSVPQERRGTQALKIILANLLCSRIRTVFPLILKDIQNQKKQIDRSLEKMGIPRDSLSKKRAYLSDIALAFHTGIMKGLQGQYESLSEDAAKLRMKVREANDTFAYSMKLEGHAIPFVERSSAVGNYEQATGKSDRTRWRDGRTSLSETKAMASQHFGGFEAQSTLFSPQPKPAVAFHSAAAAGKVGSHCPGTKEISFVPPIINTNSNYDECFQNISSMLCYRGFSFEELRLSDYLQGQRTSPEVSGITTQPTQRAFGSTLFQPSNSVLPEKTNTESASDFSFNAITQKDAGADDIYKWIRTEIKASRGTELQGTLNPSVLPILFHKQMGKWKSLSEAHFSRIKLSAAFAVSSVLKGVCKDEATKRRIEDFIRKSSEQQDKRYSRQLSDYVDSLQKKHLQTSNEAFEQKVKEARLARFSAALERYRKWHPCRTSIDTAEDGDSDTSQRLIIDMRDAPALFAELHISNSQNLEDEVHDSLKAYYEIARENFVHFVNDQIVEHYLDDQKGPVFAFSPVYVGSLTDEEVEDMAAEDDSLIRDRAEKEATLLRLSKAETIAQRCMKTQ